MFCAKSGPGPLFPTGWTRQATHGQREIPVPNGDYLLRLSVHASIRNASVADAPGITATIFGNDFKIASVALDPATGRRRTVR